MLVATSRWMALLILVNCTGLLVACDAGQITGAAPGSPAFDGDGGVVPPGGRYHPIGFASPDAHGRELEQQKQDCRGCHGATLEGQGAAPSCDACHSATTPTAWRTTCTFCHGGVNDMTGAPPRNLDGTSGAGVFPAHTRHVGTSIAAKIDCVQCHVKASDVLSPGHIFDTTPGAAEVDFGGGLDTQGRFDASSGCSSLYCHGNGRGDTGSVSKTAAAMTCTSCHAGMASDPAGRATMSGQHPLHLGVSGVTCGDCHHSVTPDGVAITAANLHVNGTREVAFSPDSAPGFAFDASAQSCTGSCHGHDHAGQAWGGDGVGSRYHPIGWADPTMHGPEMELGRQDCRGCHGQTLEGSGAAPSCDSCHNPPPAQKTAWRSDCLFCHGGSVNSTGAPPRDPGSPLASASASFVAHPAHVTGSSLAVAFDCTQCHLKPTDVLSAGHAFDATPGAGEVRMNAGLSPAGVYTATTDTCTNLYCHGNGRGDNGSYRDGSPTPQCSSCHPGMNSGSTAWGTMSGDHRRHLGIGGVTCGDCHQAVTTNGTSIANRALHIDRQREVKFSAAGFTYDPATRRCAGTCHGEGHNQTW
jgi:predicted CxxxxCH...CXXCH cytochrome family protein